MSRAAVDELVRRLHDAQCALTTTVMSTGRHDDLEKRTPDGFTVRDTLRMWRHEMWSHHRELVRARGSLAGDNPHFHVPHFVREASEEFGRFVGELACMSDSQLDDKPQEEGRTVREIAEHVLGNLSGYIPEQIVKACGSE